jgi:hypothetical protein
VLLEAGRVLTPNTVLQSTLFYSQLVYGGALTLLMNPLPELVLDATVKLSSKERNFDLKTAYQAG